MSAEGLVRYNAQRCEEAKGEKCVCHCGGDLHGSAHSEVWIKETAAMIDAAMDKGRQPTGQSEMPL